MELITLLLFSLTLGLCVILNLPVLVALVVGYLLFLGYGLLKGHRGSELIRASLHSAKDCGTILFVFLLVGAISALWRASGTIATFIELGVSVMNPALFYAIIFILNTLLSLLIGSSLGTSATMGVISISLCRVMGLNEVLTAGAVVSGIFVGDRNSPVSTSALLIATVTNTDLFDNLKRMIKTGIVPWLLTLLIYLLLGLGAEGQVPSNVTAAYRSYFNMSLLTLLPGLIIIGLSLFRIGIKKLLFISIAFSIGITFILQDVPLRDILSYTVFGFVTRRPDINATLQGGGVVSMLQACIVVFISCAYSGLFEVTGLLMAIKTKLEDMGSLITPYGAMLVTAVVTAAVACNQTLANILTNNLMDTSVPNDKERALMIENTTQTISGLIPYNIAVAIPLANMNMGSESIPYMFFLYLLPVCNFFIWESRRGKDIYKGPASTKSI
ncbi:sodium:proton antiporter [Peptoniphilus equinus]|uniref:Sodium:proton antiporter n=1 Tax=Peptoniphilus equinus TaxID=3016343 RepID=A0ABY7QW47_9FIRM|nr:Na+/H+ antiporter NhaC family protein [Peptoniphilus equinus]WBW50490.1 sodium:proton antiporter [Peptoniphilus equinus]